MVNSGFKTMDQIEREDKVCDIIAAKARGISEEHMARILEVMELDKQYSITGIADFSVFLRNAYNEDGGNVFQVKVTPIYGSLLPGQVDIAGNMTDPQAEDEDTAFLKNVYIIQGDTIVNQDSIFIYQKRDLLAV